jgi:hypothetical protein
MIFQLQPPKYLGLQTCARMAFEKENSKSESIKGRFLQD